MKYLEKINPHGRPWKVVILFLASYLLYYAITEAVGDPSPHNNELVYPSKRLISLFSGLFLLPGLWLCVRSFRTLWWTCAFCCTVNISVIIYKIVQFRSVSQLALSKLNIVVDSIWMDVIYRELIPTFVYWLPILCIAFYYFRMSTSPSRRGHNEC